MKVYHVDDSQDWDVVLDKFRQALLNEEYNISKNIHPSPSSGQNALANPYAAAFACSIAFFITVLSLFPVKNNQPL